MPNLDDIWFLVRARVEGAHAEFWAWNMLIKFWEWHMLIKYLICIIYVKNCPEQFSVTISPSLMKVGRPYVYRARAKGVHACLILGVAHADPLGPLGSKMLNHDMTTKLGQKNH